MEAPKVRPKNLKKDFDESALRAEELSKKNKSTSEEFGNLELRSDLDEHISWNSLSRLGYDPDRIKLLDAGKGYREATTQAMYAPSRMTKKGLQSSFINFDNYEDLNPDDVIVTPNVSVPRVIAHEFTHRGIDLIRELYNEDPEFFKNVYGKDAANIIETIDEEGVDEELVELFDDPSDDYKKDLYGRFIPTAGAFGAVTDSTDEIDKNPYLDIDRPYVQNKLKGSSAKDLGYFTKARMQRMIPGHVGILQAAEDLLKAQGEPPIARQKNFLQKTMGFAIGGLATEEALRSNSMKDQMKMFAEGGIRDDGMDVDPVSGNDVPSGSLASEVRDDIPAQLSEGEYVVPADVVRYFGVRVFEEMRMEAKQGLQMMEANGRIGGEPIEPPMQQQDEQGVTDADMASLEDMMRTGVANGGLMDKIAYTAMNDPMVNSKLNQGGMAIGYAPGGMVASPYNDPTKIDQVISQFMEMTKKNPAIMDELAKRGISINRTSATEKPDQMAQGNAPVETTNPITNQTPVMAAEGALVNTGFNSLSEDQQKNYATSPTTMSSMFGIPGGSYFYQGPGVPNKPVEEQNQCPPGQTFDKEKQMCVVTAVAAEPVESFTDTIDQNDKEKPIYDPKKEWRYTSTQTDWSSSTAVDEYLNSITEVKPEGFLDKALKASPIGFALKLSEKEDIKIAGYKLDAEKFIAEEIIGGAVGIKNTKVIDAHKTKWAKTLTPDMQEKVNTINQAAVAQSIINTIREIVPDAYKGVDFKGPNNTPTLADIRKGLTNEMREALISSNRGGIITAAVEAGRNMSMGAMAQKRADATFQRTESARDDAQDTIADKENISKDTRTVEGKETLASKAKRGGGFNKGGLMKKRKNK